MNQSLVVRAKELLKTNSKEMVIEKLTKQKNSRTTLSAIHKAVEIASKSLTGS